MKYLYEAQRMDNGEYITGGLIHLPSSPFAYIATIENMENMIIDELNEGNVSNLKLIRVMKKSIQLVDNLIDPITEGTLRTGKNEKYIFPKIHDPFIYSAGLSYLWKFIERYPDKSNFSNKDIINEVISTDHYLSCFKEPFMYVNDGISRIVFEFEIYKNISENNSYKLDVDNINVKEIINFAEKLIRSNGF